MSYKPDTMTLPKSSSGSPHPEGQFAAVCVDVIDLGDRVESFPGSPTKVVRKVALVFASGETNADTGTLHTVSAEYTASTYEKASLRQMLESWRGKAYRDGDLDAGLPLHKLAGQAALMTVEHLTSKTGRTFAKLRAITPVPRQMTSAVPSALPYDRAPYWQERKEEYAAGVRKYRAETAAASHEQASHEQASAPEQHDPADDLPS